MRTIPPFYGFDLPLHWHPLHPTARPRRWQSWESEEAKPARGERWIFPRQVNGGWRRLDPAIRPRHPERNPAAEGRGSDGLLQVAAVEDMLLEAGDAAFDPDGLSVRVTPGGWTEQEVLLSLNAGGKRDLSRYPGFGPKIVAEILQHRRRAGFFSAVDELIHVPLIGPVRFARLVGRQNLFEAMPLHATLRLPPANPISVRSLQPLLWAAPDLPRLYLGAIEEAATERRLSERNSHDLRMAKVGSLTLFLHFKRRRAQGWAAYVETHLPRLLRSRLNANR